jgi:uncharacterized metal-binding protein YceD (DUF177 family)
VFPVRDLDSGPKLVRTKIAADWLASLLEDTEVRPHGTEVGELSLSLSLNDRDVLVRGKLDVIVEVPCARTLDPAVYRLKPEVFLLLSKGAEADRHGEGRRRREGDSASKKGHAKSGSGGPGKGGQKGGKGGWEEDPLLGREEAARDHYTGDSVILDDFLREFILLEVPMVPLREDLREEPFEASPSPPGGAPAAVSLSEPGVEKPLDPRLSPLADLKARLEKKDKKE